MHLIAAAGGSGGHCYPAIAFLQACKNRHPDWKLTLAVDRGSKTLGLELEAAAAGSVREIASAKYAGTKSLVSLKFWSALAKGSGEAKQLLRETGADLVAGFGGYGSFPVVWEAASMGIPTIVHEQNAVLGMANRVLAGRVTRLAVSLELATPPFKSRPERLAHTGFPLRTSLRRMDRESVLRRFDLDPAKRVLLVFGGSQGSRFLNQLMDDLIKVHGRELERTWQILHLTGRVMPGGGPPRPDILTGSYRRWTYSREMDALYTAADLAVCRAGSATLHELAYYARPALFIPYPYAHGHQLLNARVVADGGGAWILEEKECTLDQFKGYLDQAAADPAALRQMGENAGRLLKTDGAAALVDLAEQLAARGTRA